MKSDVLHIKTISEQQDFKEFLIKLVLNADRLIPGWIFLVPSLSSDKELASQTWIKAEFSFVIGRGSKEEVTVPQSPLVKMQLWNRFWVFWFSYEEIFKVWLKYDSVVTKWSAF